MKCKSILLILLFIFSLTSCNDRITEDLEKAPQEEKVITDNSLEYFAYDPNQSTKSTKSGTTGLPYFNDIDILTPTRLKVKVNGYFTYIDNFNSPHIHSGYVDQITRLDVKREDGWEVIYNFIPHNLDEPLVYPIVILYNRYRGAYKLMYYHINRTEAHDGAIFASLAITGNSIKTTSLFNCSSSIIDPLERKVGEVVNMSSDSGDTQQITGLINGAWYAFEWDVAYYDSSITSDNVKFQVWGSDIKEISITGITNGTISGNIQVGVSPATDNGIVSTKSIGDALKKGGTKAVMKFAGDDLVDFFKKKSDESTGLFKSVFGMFDSKLISGAASSILGPAASFISKPISKLLGKIFPGKPAQPINHIVNLKTNLKTELTGTIEQNISIPPINLPILEGDHLGVFSLSKRPRLKISEAFLQYCFSPTDNQPTGLDSYRYSQFCVPLDNVEDIVSINPELLEIATVEKFFTTVCIDYHNQIFKEAYESNPSDFSVIFDGKKSILVKDVFRSVIFDMTPPRYSYPGEWNNPKPNSDLVYKNPVNIFVRLNLIIRPKNGDAPVSHMYYIKPDFIEDQKYTPYPRKMNDDFGFPSNLQ